MPKRERECSRENGIPRAWIDWRKHCGEADIFRTRRVLTKVRLFSVDGAMPERFAKSVGFTDVQVGCWTHDDENVFIGRSSVLS